MPPIGDARLEELLRRGTSVWNAERPPGWLNLADLDLDNLDLRGADLSHAGMWGCNLTRTDLSDATLDAADLKWTNLCGARLIRTSVQGTDFSDAWIYGAAVWDLRGQPKSEARLRILPDDGTYSAREQQILNVGAGGLRLAQFLSSAYSALTAPDPDPLMSGMVDAFSSRVCLLLGRFSDTAQNLGEIARILKNSHSIIPMVFNFSRPDSRDLTESVTLWARMCSFIIVDLSAPSSVPHELASVVPFLPSVPVYPVIGSGERPYSMFEHLLRYPWVRQPVSFSTSSELEAVIATMVAESDHRVR